MARKTGIEQELVEAAEAVALGAALAKADANVDADGVDAPPDISDRLIAVRSTVEGFRRAGRTWTVEETVLPVAEFSDAQIQALSSEPRLVVVFLP
jgi:hypothetical protein